MKPQAPQSVADIIARVKRPKKAVVTAGMPYANGPLHIGHLAGAHIPADIYSRYLKMLIGDDNVLFVCGTDDHGSTSEVAALQNGKTINEFIDGVHETQKSTLDAYSIGLDVYTGTSSPETLPMHTELCNEMLTKMFKNDMLSTKTTKQWFDTEHSRFLPDRYVYGTCPNEKCGYKKAYSDECDSCGKTYDPGQLIDPISTISDKTPILKDTAHWWLDMWKVSDVMREWIESKQKTWRKPVYNEVITTVLPCIIFSNTFEDIFKEHKDKLPKHKSRYAPGKKVIVQFFSLEDLEKGKSLLQESGVESELVDGWAHRSITRDVAWGVPLPVELDEQMKGKTLYVWPESLIAPISFSKLALKSKGLDPESYKDYWCDPEAKVYQFLGQDNVYFYVLMQAALWLGSQADPFRMPNKGELQLTDIFGNFHLQINNEKMSKSTGNFYTGDQLLQEKGYSPDQIRYFLALLSLPEKNSNFDFGVLEDRNKFLAGPLNASFEKPISACNSKFDGIVPEGKLLEKPAKETMKIVQNYLRAMEKGEYSKILFAIENYARQINSIFTQHKPHDDRFPEEQRKDALYSCFYILKNLMIMLYPFVPATMNELRKSLNLPEDTFKIDNLGTDIQSGHKIGEQRTYFPAAE